MLCLKLFAIFRLISVVYLGSAYIYVTSDRGSTWSQRSKIVASDGADGDLFGYSVSICGNITVIGSPYDDDKGPDSAYLCI